MAAPGFGTKPAALEQRARDALAQKSAAARDYDSHARAAFHLVRPLLQRAIIVFWSGARNTRPRTRREFSS